MNLELWQNKPWITIKFRKDFGKDILVAKEGPPKFRLIPKLLKNGYGEKVAVGFNIDFEDGRMLENWGSLQFTPRGTEPPKSLAYKLPPYADEYETLYSDALDPIVTALYAADSRVERLEAKLPLFLNRCADSKRQMTLDRVRMVYLENAVDGPDPDLVVVVFSWADGFKVMQNGVGSGPPRNVDP